jgi:DNA-binding NarL/FixJ family response regulator
MSIVVMDVSMPGLGGAKATAQTARARSAEDERILLRSDGAGSGSL